MSERGVEHEEAKAEVPRGVQAAVHAPPERIVPALGDLRFHTDAGALTVARAPADGDRLLADELAQVVRGRGAPRTVARDFIDDIKSWWGGEEQAKKVERKEVPVTKQDFDQIITLVSVPLANAQMMLAGEADVAKAKSALGKVGPAGDALMVIANTKQEAKNRDNLYTGTRAIARALTTLQVMAEPDKARELWKEHFQKAMERVDQVLALPIRDESSQGQGQAQGPGQGQAQPAGSPDDTLTQRDHDLIRVGLKAQLEALITTTSGEPYQDWDPKAVVADTSVVTAASAFTNRKLLSVRARVEAGLQAIKAFAMSLNEQQAEAIANLEQAQSDIARSMQSFVDADPTDPNSPSFQPPAQP
jgi:hypothetical protein